MASSSKSLNMPLIFVVSIGASVSLIAITMFGLAWYQYESRVVLHDQVLVKPTHDGTYERALAQEQDKLGDIEKAMHQFAAEQAALDQHGEHGEQHDAAGEEAEAEPDE